MENNSSHWYSRR